MSVVLNLALRVAVLLVLAWLGTSLLRRRSASIRATVWTVALGAALFLPIVSGFFPAWRVRVLEPADAPLTATVSPVFNTSPVADTTAAQTIERVSIPHLPSGVIAASPAETRRHGMDPARLLFVALAAIAALLFGRVLAAHIRLSRLARKACDADPMWMVLVDGARADLGISRRVVVRMTDATSVPAVAGVWRPVLLLPVDTNDWPLDLRRAVVLHELAHVTRWDGLGQLLGHIACSIYWFVPLVWYAAARASVLRERASDDAVLRAGVKPSAYADSLLSLVRASAAGSTAALAMAQPSRIQERVMAILNPGTKRDQLSWRSVAAVCVLVAATTVVVGAVQPAERERTLTAAPARTDVSLSVESAPGVPMTTAPKPRESSRVIATAEQAGDRFCGGRSLNHNSQLTNDDGKTKRWTVRLAGDGCSVDLKAEGEIQFNADFTDIDRISQNGFFRLDVTDRGVRRELEIEPRGAGLTRTWRVDGREHAYDSDAKAWFAAFLIELDRRTAIGVDIRLPLLLKQGGVDGVLKETALTDSDYVRSRYWTGLAKAARLTSGDIVRILKQAVALKTTDYYAGELVKAYSSSVRESAVRAAMIDLVNAMTNDYYIATSIEAIVGPGAPGPAELDVLVKLVPRMSNDHYKMQVLLKVLQADSLTSSQQVVIANAVSVITNDYYASEVLKPLAKKGLRDESVRRAFFEAAGKIKNDYYLSETLQAVLNVSSLTERELMDVVSSAKPMRGDHYKALVLERAARHAAATDRVRSASLDASAGMAQYYADQVKRAAGK